MPLRLKIVKNFTQAKERFGYLFKRGVRELSTDTSPENKFFITLPSNERMKNRREKLFLSEMPLVGPRVTLDLVASVDKSGFSDFLYKKLDANEKEEYGKILQKLLDSKEPHKIKPSSNAEIAALATHAMNNISRFDRIRVKDESALSFLHKNLKEYAEANKTALHYKLGGESGHTANAIRRFFKMPVALHASGIPYLKTERMGVERQNFLLPPGSSYYYIEPDGSVHTERWGQLEFAKIPSKLRKDYDENKPSNMIIEFNDGSRPERLIVVPEQGLEKDAGRPGIRDFKGKLANLGKLDPQLAHTIMFASRLQKAKKTDWPKLKKQLDSFKGFVSAETSGLIAEEGSWQLFKHADFVGTNEKEILALAKGLGITATEKDLATPSYTANLLSKILYSSDKIKSVTMHFKNGAMRALKPELFPTNADARAITEIGKTTAVGLAFHHSDAKQYFEEEKKEPLIDDEDIAYHLSLSKELEKKGATPLDVYGHLWKAKNPGKQEFLVSFMPKCKFKSKAGLVVGAGDTTSAINGILLSNALRKIQAQTKK